MEWKEAEISFHVNGKKHEFKCIHNLPDEFGLNIECALDNWLARTKDFTFNSFRQYIASKDHAKQWYLFSEEEWNDENLINSIFNT